MLPMEGQRWEHYRGTIYRVIRIARLAATREPMVVYDSEDDESSWVRPLTEWLDFVCPEGSDKPVPRFVRYRHKPPKAPATPGDGGPKE